MKKYLLQLILVVLIVYGCNTGETKRATDTAGVPPATDTMPILNPGMFDSSGTIRTPPTGDDNSIMPDSTIKKK